MPLIRKLFLNSTETEERESTNNNNGVSQFIAQDKEGLMALPLQVEYQR